MQQAKLPSSPKVVVLAGPNGAGKSTTAPRLLRGVLGVEEFVNADTIAAGLSGFAPDRAAMAAGRVMLRRLRELAASKANFAFETTLASRSFAPWLARLRADGYRTHLVFLWLPSADTAVARVAQRVASGGHDVPEEVVRRRYAAGLRHFFSLYQTLADSWQFVDNTTGVGERPRIIAFGSALKVARVVAAEPWQRIQAQSKAP
ncbi:MAG: Zeta toxin family protein [Planctomycetota bacterium]|nr:MAG: Zeta toxin family protein [Planctomycetota bacterium]